MNAKSTLILILLLATTTYAAVSRESRAERARRIRSMLGRNAFVSTNSQVEALISGGGRSRKVQLSVANLDAQDAPDVVVTSDERRRMQRLRQPSSQERTVTTMLNLQDIIIGQGGCNRNLCFALDASRKLSQIDFLLQRDFVQLIVATLSVDNDMHVAARQYGPNLRSISRLSSNIDAFLLRLDNFKRQKGRPRNFLAAAMLGCRLEMAPRVSDANKMVIIGNGRTSFVKREIALIESRIFRSRNGAICAIAVENSNRNFFTKLTGDSARVLGVTDYTRFDEILTEIVTDICGLQ